MRLQTASGTASAGIGNNITVNGQSSNTDSKLDTVGNGFIPKYQNSNPAGSGYSVDTGFKVGSPEGIELQWVTADAASEIDWSGVPQMTLNGSSTFNGQFPGGYKRLVSFIQVLPIKNTASLSIPLSGFRLEFSDTHISNFDLPAIAMETKLTSGPSIRLEYDSFFQTLGLQWRSDLLTITLRSDSLDLGGAKAIMLGLGLRKNF